MRRPGFWACSIALEDCVEEGTYSMATLWGVRRFVALIAGCVSGGAVVRRGAPADAQGGDVLFLPMMARRVRRWRRTDQRALITRRWRGEIDAETARL